MSRVLMVSSLWPPVTLGGAEIYAARLAGELRARGHDVGVLTLGVDGADVVERVAPWPYRLETWAAQAHWKRALFHAGDLYRPATHRSLRAAVARFDPDVVHSHAVQGLSTAALTTPAGLRRPHVHTLHDYWLLCQRTTLRRRSGRPCGRCSACGVVSALRRTALRRSGPDVYLAPSQAVARHHALDAGLTARLHVLQHPADAGRERPPRPDGRGVTFGYLGQLTEAKGVRTLLGAFEAFSAGGQAAARLLVAGTGPLAAVVAERADGRVRALGWVDGPARERFFDDIDCLVVPSEWDEPAGLVVVEAAARGVPVIGARAGGIPEYVAPASRPLLFAPGDEADLVRAMARFVARAQAPAGDTVGHLPTWSEHVARIEAAYATAAADRATRRRA